MDPPNGLTTASSHCIWTLVEKDKMRSGVDMLEGIVFVHYDDLSEVDQSCSELLTCAVLIHASNLSLMAKRA